MKSKIYITLLCIISFGASKNLMAQSDFYAIDHIPEIRLQFVQSNWDEILDSLYLLGEDFRLGADCTIDGVAYDKVGVRYKGFSSYSSSRNKNPLNIDLDYAFSEQAHQGFHKVKLSNVIQDPSFVREVLSYEVARKYMPASKANYANVYINDTLIGLYTNVEAVNGKFLDEHFGSSNTTFVKGNPETIDLNGENANLGNSPGAETYDYHSLYNMKSTGSKDWDNLYEFIDVLNTDPNNVESLLNIDRTLWMHAFNYSLINFDSYVGYAQNYYLFQDVNGQFNPILWDLNMSFASYRLTDASDQWDGFTIAEAKTIDPLQHLNSFSVQPRPLITNVIQNPMYERMYIAHLTTIIEENFDNGLFETRAAYFQSLIDLSVQTDTNKFYTYMDFIENLDSTVSDLVDYPGIVDLMEDRSDYILSYPGYQYRPEFMSVDVVNPSAIAGDELWITADLTGMVNGVYLAYRFAETEVFSVVQMSDDGLHQDGGSADNMFGAKIENASNLVQYYVYAENDSSGRFAPERAAYEFFEHESPIRFQDLVINEVMSVNSILLDENYEYDDWLELYNTTDYSISLNDLYLSNDPASLTKWALPTVVLDSDRYAQVWLDDSTQGAYHANFDLDGSGDSLWLSYGNGTVIDSIVLGQQYNATSFGRYPNGTGNFVEMVPSPLELNGDQVFAIVSDDVFIFPNPTSNAFNIKTNKDLDYTIDLYSIHGRKVMGTRTLEGNGQITIDSSKLANGIYLVYVSYNEESATKKIMITH
ncbi:MAG: spore coat protein CotH [Salibacteraceae bacterium]